MAEMIQVRAIARGVTQTPRKIGLVASLVRGRTVADALTILSHTPKRAARPLTKVIESAKANALNTHGLTDQGLLIHSLQITAGPRLKRYRPVARGQAHPYQKRTSHIHVVVAGVEKPKKQPAKKTTAKKESK
jgi:large subunit ribosomal protein L22